MHEPCQLWACFPLQGGEVHDSSPIPYCVCIGWSLEGTWICPLLAYVLSLGDDPMLGLRAGAPRNIHTWVLQVKGAGPLDLVVIFPSPQPSHPRHSPISLCMPGCTLCNPVGGPIWGHRASCELGRGVRLGALQRGSLGQVPLTSARSLPPWPGLLHLGGVLLTSWALGFLAPNPPGLRASCPPQHAPHSMPQRQWGILGLTQLPCKKAESIPKLPIPKLSTKTLMILDVPNPTTHGCT